LQIDGDVLQRLDAKRGAAGGPTGWTYARLIAAAQAPAEATSAILAVVNLILSGKLPRHDSLLDASLIGPQKPGNGVRPIAIGEVWYRFASLCALMVLAAVGPSLALLQLGMGVSGGVDAASHAIRAAAQRTPSRRC
jgi:hypothetical protein